MIYAFKSQLISRFICSLITVFLLLGGWEAAVGSTGDGGSAQEARLSRQFTLKVGREVAIKGERLRIKFAEVKEDSRCPQDVTCVWAGNAAVRLEVSTSRKHSKSLTLNTMGSSQLPDQTQYDNYLVRLVGLSPYPNSTQQSSPRDYTVTLLISRERPTPKAAHSMK